MDNELQSIEPVAKILAATAISQSLSFCMERKYLQGITDEENQLFEVVAVPSTAITQATWIEIQQVGKPLENSAESCFTAIQKILYSCFLPKDIQLLFLIIKNEKENKMYLGVRSPYKAVAPKSMVRNLNEFIKGAWPGLQTKIIREGDVTIDEFKKALNDEIFEYTFALTGIPSMESQYQTVYPATIDKLMAGINQCDHFAYLVVADPIDPGDTENMLYQCREMNGQAESLKAMNVTEGLSSGTNSSVSTSHQEGISNAHAVSLQKKDFTKLGKIAMTATGLATAASIFPAAGAVLEGVVDTAGGITAAAAGLIAGSTVSNFISGLMPQKTVTDTVTTNSSDATTTTQGTSESKSQSISRSVVNKHIEAVSENLSYQAKRIESGKAVGLWKVGVYIMGEKKSDLQGVGLQLRSILSGQESVFEPIRMHDITAILDEEQEKNHSFKELTLGKLASPVLAINDIHGNRFEHPLGEHFRELKSVLNTKELSYLINFPLRTVPGISVVDSSPEFNLNPQKLRDNQEAIAFGKMLYGGSLTNIPYQIPIDLFSRHTLISGINGSGKTNTIQAIMNHLGNLPFLVIEPAKTEYVDWALEYNKNHPDDPVSIYVPGCKIYKGAFEPTPLKLNPFEIVWLKPEQEVNVLTHIDRLKSSFAAAFPMYDILPVLMEDLIYTVYQNKSTDWLNKAPVYGKTLSPTLNSMSLSVDLVIEHRQYEDKVQRNMKACLNTRIDSLKRGWKGNMLNTVKSTPWNELFGKKCIVNLSYVGDDVDKAFFMALLLQFLYEYRAAQAEVGDIDFNDNGCKHLTIIEEAHRVMAKCDNQELPQYKSAMMFSNMLSEIRAYGEGLMLIDQVPTRLIPDAIKNTNLKITHRLVAEDDCKAIGESMGLSDEQRKVIPKLLTGQCIISSSLETNAYWVKADKVK